MPSSTPKQARTMAAAAHDPAFARRMGIPAKVAKDFNQADKGSALLSRANSERPMDSKAYIKGGDIKEAAYAQGGAVLGRTRDFIKGPNQFTDTNDEVDSNARGASRYQSRYAKGGANSGEPNPKGAFKSPKSHAGGEGGAQSKGGCNVCPDGGRYAKTW